jgi:hypothetical protein
MKNPKKAKIQVITGLVFIFCLVIVFPPHTGQIEIVILHRSLTIIGLSPLFITTYLFSPDLWILNRYYKPGEIDPSTFIYPKRFRFMIFIYLLSFEILIYAITLVGFSNSEINVGHFILTFGIFGTLYNFLINRSYFKKQDEKQD